MLRTRNLLLSLAILLSLHLDVEAAAPDFEAKLWTFNIPYSFGSGISDAQKDDIRAALRMFTANTCLDFEENSTVPNMEFVLADECSSFVGDTRGPNSNHDINLKSDCMNVKAAQHEIMHALGFQHTQERTDRDDYVNIYFDKIPDSEKNLTYGKVIQSSNYTNYGIPYDFGGILQHSSRDNDNTVIMLPTSPDYEQTMDTHDHGMIFNDWKVVNLHYKCYEKCSERLDCQNGGYQHPRSCKCVCSRFYNGTNCELEQNPLNLETGETQKLNNGWPLDKPNYQGSPDIYKFPFNQSPARIIKAPVGHKIRVTINNIAHRNLARVRASPFGECSMKALEIVEGADLSQSGKRFCGQNELPYSFLSNDNVIGYFLYSMQGLDFVANITVTAVDPSKPEPTIEPEPTTPPTPTTTDNYVPPVDPEDPRGVDAMCEKTDPWWEAEGTGCNRNFTVRSGNIDHVIIQRCVIVNRKWSCTKERRKDAIGAVTTPIAETTTTTLLPTEPPLTAATTTTAELETTTAPIPDTTTTHPADTTITTTAPQACTPPLPTFAPLVCNCDKESVSECNNGMTYPICKMVDGVKKYTKERHILVCTQTDGEWKVTTNTTIPID